MHTEEEWTALLDRVSKLERTVAALSNPIAAFSNPPSVSPWDGRIDIEANRLISKLEGDCTLWHFVRIGNQVSLRTCLKVPNDDNNWRTLVIPIPEGINPRSIEAWEVVRTAIENHFEQHKQPKP